MPSNNELDENLDKILLFFADAMLHQKMQDDPRYYDKKVAEAKQKLIKWRDTHTQAEVERARIDELEQTISFFDDEGRESKDVLYAFKKNRIDTLKRKKGE